jgi:hypothetical protein
LKDGCGVNVTNRRRLINNGGGKVPNILKKFIDYLGLVGRIKGPRSMNSGRFKKPGAGVGKGEAHDYARLGRVSLSEPDRQLGKDAAHQLATTGHNPPNWAVDEALWEKAKAAADKGNYDDDTYWAVVAHIYQQMGGKISSTKNADSAQSLGVQVRKGVKVKPGAIERGTTRNQDEFDECVSALLDTGMDSEEAETICDGFEQNAAHNCTCGGSCGKCNSVKNAEGEVPEGSDEGSSVSSSGANSMKLNTAQRASLIRGLANNVRVWKGKEQILAALPDSNLIDLKRKYDSQQRIQPLLDLVDNATSTDDPAAFIDWLKAAPEDIQSALISGIRTQLMGGSGGDDSALDGIPEPDADDMDMVGASRDSEGHGWNNDSERKAAAARMSEEDDWEGENNRRQPAPKSAARGKRPAAPARPVTANEWMKSAPPQIRSAVQNAMRIEQGERKKLVQRIVANVQDPRQRANKARFLMQKDVGELQEIVECLPPVRNRRAEEGDSAYFPQVDALGLSLNNNRKRRAKKGDEDYLDFTNNNTGGHEGPDDDDGDEGDEAGVTDFGGAESPTGNRQDQRQGEDTMLIPPTMNYDGMASERLVEALRNGGLKPRKRPSGLSASRRHN